MSDYLFSVKQIAVPLVLSTAAAVALFPGFLLTIPPLPQGIQHSPLSKRVIRTERVTGPSVAVHGLLLFIVLAVIWTMYLRRMGCVKLA